MTNPDTGRYLNENGALLLPNAGACAELVESQSGLDWVGRSLEGANESQTAAVVPPFWIEGAASSAAVSGGAVGSITVLPASFTVSAAASVFLKLTFETKFDDQPQTAELVLLGTQPDNTETVAYIKVGDIAFDTGNITGVVNCLGKSVCVHFASPDLLYWS